MFAPIIALIPLNGFWSFMCCWRVFIISLRLTLLLTALGSSAAYANGIDAKSSIPAICIAASSGVATTGADDLYADSNLASGYQLFNETQRNINDIYNPPIFYSDWQQFGTSLPPFERQAVTAFKSLWQLEPLFVIAYEFLPEIRARKYFLTLLPPKNNLPWYLRATTSHKHNRVTGWKDGNNLYTGSITYLS
ncbi:MAG: hypothetical protein ACJA13_001694 [Paraglaciecola sp.]|jgi:hypothetical protein